MTPRHLGLDLGATNVKWVVVELDGSSPRVLATGQAPTDTSRGERSVVEQLIEIARDTSLDLGRLASVGVGVPGLYDPAEGTTRFMPNVPGNWAGAPVAAEIGEAVASGYRCSAVFERLAGCPPVVSDTDTTTITVNTPRPLRHA